MNFNIIGAGRLGKNIALALNRSQLASLTALCNSNLSSSLEACHQIGSGVAVDDISSLPAADCTWITCSDDSIQPLIHALAQQHLIKPGSLVFHVSGVHNSTLFAPLQEQGCFAASFHPLKAFKKGYLDANAFDKVDCILEGDEPACTWLEHTFYQLGAKLQRINPEAKATYHAAACLASNYLVTLATYSETLFLQAGIAPDKAREMICTLMQGNINNIRASAFISEALTGPLVRGDKATLALHLQAIKNPELKNLYTSAGKATLALTELSEEKRRTITDLFESN